MFKGGPGIFHLEHVGSGWEIPTKWSDPLQTSVVEKVVCGLDLLGSLGSQSLLPVRASSFPNPFRGDDRFHRHPKMAVIGRLIINESWDPKYDPFRRGGANIELHGPL